MLEVCNSLADVVVDTLVGAEKRRRRTYSLLVGKLAILPSVNRTRFIVGKL